MANEEQLSILKQGVKAWNEWQYSNLRFRADLEAADLNNADLQGINLREAILRHADLTRANLRESDLSLTDLTNANLEMADLTGISLRRAGLRKANLTANLAYAQFHGADLGEACLIGASLTGAEFQVANLTEADLNSADLSYAVFKGTLLAGSNFSKVHLYETSFLQLDMSEIVGLEDLFHDGPSTIGTNTLVLSKGKIPEIFLRGCGLSDWEIEMAKLYNPDLRNDQRSQMLYKIYDLQASQAIQIAPLFISYSHADKGFIDKVDMSLTKRGVRFWRDIHDLKAGRIEMQIDRAISQDRTVLLVLSKSSTASDWVEHEVRKAREIAKNSGRDTLCPIALDDSWKKSPWPARVMEQIMEYNVLDFSEWQDDSQFDVMFRKLIDGLELFYKG